MPEAPNQDKLLQIEAVFAQILREKSGFELADLDRDASFLELGFDSLFLIQLSQTLRKRFGVKVTFRQLIEEIPSADALLGYLAASDGIKLGGGSRPTQSPVREEVTQSPVAEPVASSAPPAAQEQRPPMNGQSVVRSPSAGSVQSTPADPPATAVADAASQYVMPETDVPTSAAAPLEAQYETPAAAMPQVRPPQIAPISNQVEGVVTPGANPTVLQQLVLQQTALMGQQLELLSRMSARQTALGNGGQDSSVPAVPIAVLPAVPASPSHSHEAPGTSQDAAVCSEHACGQDEARAGHVAEVAGNSIAVPSAENRGQQKDAKRERFGPYKPVRKGLNGQLTDSQQEHLHRFIQRFTTKTCLSKKHAETHRDYFADPRGVAGYRRIWKSMVYQICVERSKGSKLWDIDGNEYVDIAMGFGLNLFGQSPEFVTQAIAQQLGRGVEVGPQSPIAGEVAQLLCDFSRKDRATFCNTGSEAVMAALRLARTVNGKPKCVFFNKDYHGNFDEVLLRSNGRGASRQTAPAAPGVPQAFADNAIVLDYGTEEALQTIRERADEIAAVLIEPVQSADPFNQPREFLQEIRRITRENDIAMIMDEVITGFRAAPGGAQEWFDVWADMATYGKILGGGLPIGALAGSKEYMDALDGGTWKYDDDSEPEADMTFFAGTFVRHPLALSAAHQILMKLKDEGPQLQIELTARTEKMASELNDFFEREQFPIRVAQFASLFRFMFPQDLEFADMLYFHLLDRGVFTRGWGDNCFLSTEHSDEDIRKVVEAVKQSCLEIRDAGFFPEKAANASEAPTMTQQPAAGCRDAGAAANGDAANNCSPNLGAQEASEPAGKSDAGCLPALHEMDADDDDQFSTISEIRDEGERPPLFCMPAADGLTRIYHELSDALGDDQPMYGLHVPAVFGEVMPDTLEQLAARFIRDMREVQPTGPYHVIGYCSGGTVAIEVARQLVEAGEQVQLLGTIETYNWLDAPSTNPTRLVQLGYQIQRLDFHWRNFWLLPAPDKAAFIRSKWNSLWNRLGVWSGNLRSALRIGKPRRSAGTPKLDWAEIWRVNDRLAEAYVPREIPGRMLRVLPKQDYRCHLGGEFAARDGIDTVRLRCYPAATMVAPFVEDLATILRREIDASMRFPAAVQSGENDVESTQNEGRCGSEESCKNPPTDANSDRSELSYS